MPQELSNFCAAKDLNSSKPTMNENELTADSNCNWTICDPRKSVYRYIILIFMCLLGFGSVYCFDIPGALQDNITKDMQVSTAQFSNLYAWYSWPNVVLGVFEGYLIDRVFGIRWGAIIFGFIVLIGQTVFSLGAQVNLFGLMEFGRFIFGIGGESLSVVQNTYLASWFIGKELNMVFGLLNSVARLASTINFNVTPLTYSLLHKVYSGYTCLGITLFIATLVCVFSQICVFVSVYLDRRAEKVLNKTVGETGEVIRLKDIKDFPLTFWLITVVCLAYFGAVFPFVGLGKVFFSRKYGFTDVSGMHSASTLDSTVYTVSAFASPFCGILVDKVGYNLYWVFAAIISALFCHLMLGFTNVTPWIPLVLLGFGFSFLTCGLWPMVALEIPGHQLATAYGILQSLQNLGTAMASMAAGAIVDSKGYIFVEIFFVDLLCVAMIGCTLLFVANSNKGGVLNLSAKEKRRREAELQAASMPDESLSTTESPSGYAQHLLMPK